MKEKKKYNSYNLFALDILSKKHSFTTIYIRRCIRGEKNNLKADAICKEYKKLVKEYDALKEKKLNEV